MLAEKEKTCKISIKQFYIRRILRIWPLYYLILILGFFILPHFEFFSVGYLTNSFENNFYSNLILYVLILPNIAFSFYSAVPNIGQVWSIGVEEQFYVFWPIIIAKSKYVLRTLIAITIVLILIKVTILLLGYFYENAFWYKPVKLFVAMSKFECMSIGGIGAYFLYTNHRILKLVYNPFVLILSLIFSIALIYFTPMFLQDGIHLVYSILFLQIILFTAKNSASTFFDNKAFNYLGKISYGLYMYHFMIIPFCLNLYLKHFRSDSELVENIFVYTTVIISTILISAASYYFLELRFIKLKSRYSLIKSNGTN